MVNTEKSKPLCLGEDVFITENNVGGPQESVSTLWSSHEYNFLSVSMGFTSWLNQPGM